MVKGHEGPRSPDSRKRESVRHLQDSSDLIVHAPLTIPDIIDKGIYDIVVNTLTTISLKQWTQRQEIVHGLLTILSRPSVLEVLFYLIQFKAASARELREKHKFSKQGIYNALNFLMEKGVVVKALPIRAGRRYASIYALKEHTPEDIVEAVSRDRISRTHRYTEVQRITQITLDEYLPLLRSKGYEDIYTSEVMSIIKRTQRGFQSRDLYRPVIENLREMGVLVVSCPTRRITILEA